MTFHIVLFEPEIPPNTGNIIRLCANTSANLHLIEPLGYAWDDKKLRRAGLDYHDLAHVTRHADFASYLAAAQPQRIFAFSTKGKRYYSEATFSDGDHLMFGPETRGLPDNVLEDPVLDAVLRIPMQAASRSLNLANAVAVTLYEAWRQQDFAGLQ